MPVVSRSRLHPATAADRADPTASGQLYDAYFTPIYWYCHSRLGDATAAEDAASTVFSRALAAGPRYGDPSLRSWLFGIAHNVLANTLAWSPNESHG